MSVENAIAQSELTRSEVSRAEPEVAAPTERRGFEIPPELMKRYEVRAIEGSGNDQRIGLFVAGDREAPAIEIANNRIVARKEDPETIASLVKIAEHNGWDKIDVEGSPEFRKAVWTAGTRAGLTVNGYEPSFGEQEKMDALRRDGAADGKSREAGDTLETAAPVSSRQTRSGPEVSAVEPAPLAARPDFNVGVEGTIVEVGTAKFDSKAVKETPYVELQLADGGRERAWGVGLPDALDNAEKSVGDNVRIQRLGVQPVEVPIEMRDPDTGEITTELRTVNRNQWAVEGRELQSDTTRHPEPETAVARNDVEQAVGAMEVVASTVSSADSAAPVEERTDGAAARPSASAALDAIDAREAVEVDERAIVQRVFERGIRELEARGDPRAAAARETAAALIDQLDAEREGKANVGTSPETARQSEPDPEGERVREEQYRRQNERRPESDELAELFLHGANDKVEADPRLTNARHAQAAMEQHIAEVFHDDPGQAAAANLESRQMISDVLRRGLDVSVREPTPVRQIENTHTPPEMER
jgi:hypothetical protein